MVRTRIFDLARERGFVSDRKLAQAMGLGQATICRLRYGRQSVTAKVIDGARRAFPDLSLDELFYTESAPNGEKEQVA